LAAQHRLTTLYQLRLVDRFQPLDRRFVSGPYHYVLDQLGAMVAAAEADKDPDQTHWQHEAALAIGRIQRLAHLVGTNGFFSALLAEGRHQDDRALSLWWSERFCASNFNEIARPDGLGSGRSVATGSPSASSRPLHRDPRTAGEKAQELRGSPDRQRLRLLDPILLRPPPPRSRCPAGPGTNHRPGCDGGSGADTAAERGDLGAHWLRRMPDAPR